MRFWAYFPTAASSLVGGILNAPWETDDARATVLPENRCNEELLRAAADLVVQSLPQLSEADSPAGHLDLLPRRREAGDDGTVGDILRRRIFAGLRTQAVVPNQDGRLCLANDLLVPPVEVTPRQTVLSRPLNHWSEYQHRPVNWLHNQALSSDRLSAIARIADGGSSQRGHLERMSIEQWLQALIDAGRPHDDAVGASKAAILTAAAFDNDNLDFGEIVLAEDGSWRPLERDGIFLPGDGSEQSTTIHPDLVNDPEVWVVLDRLQVQPPSSESALRRLAGVLLEGGDIGGDHDAKWLQFWNAVASVPSTLALEIIQQHPEWYERLRVRTEDDAWHPVTEVLLPGPIVSNADPDNLSFVVDKDFHKPHLSVLDHAGVSDGPKQSDPVARRPKFLLTYVNTCLRRYQNLDHHATPRRSHLQIFNSHDVMPLDVFPKLPRPARANFTYALLSLNATFDTWHIRHDTVDAYEAMEIHAFAFEAVRQFGLVETSTGFRQITDGLGEQPKSREVQQWLLEHSNTTRIRRAFGDELQVGHDGPVTPVGDDEPIQLLDLWPGLKSYLRAPDWRSSLVRCDDLLDDHGDSIFWHVAADSDTIYIRRQPDERDELEQLCGHFGLDFNGQVFEQILSHRTEEDVAGARAAVHAQPTEGLKLLEAIGEHSLRRRLPPELLVVLDHSAQGLEGVSIAEAAIATFHTGALKEYREYLEHLDPPQRFAGNRAALKFVRELGFGDEWAGATSPKRSPYVDVDGPQSFPKLHHYQRRAANNIIDALSDEAPVDDRRGMLSMPTGSGKTRVAVKAIIEAVDHGLQGDILWVADRDELCEQAVEDWQRSWRAVGVDSRRLRVSRLWGGQSDPEPIDNATNVIVASIQTLHARTRSAPPGYLSGVRLVVIDEAHASIAPIYTELLDNLGLLQWRRNRRDEMRLIGLTATPYRGISIEETQRLRARYGGNRFDFGAFSSDSPETVVSELQQLGVLAHADQDEIPGGQLELSSNELFRLRQLRLLPDEAANRLASDVERTNRIVDSYMRQVRGELGPVPTLIFATTVRHAETVAALLHLRGVSARSVSGKTDTPVRRSIVEQYRNGEIDVLVNYGVFREGFDAPKTQAIIVARPVYSPNLYFQMIGRGLRGPLNGGSERCLILNVADTIDRFEGRLAYTEVEGLWD